MEELLNKLIKKGWKPFGRETRHELSSGVVYDTIDIKGKGDIRVIDRWHHHIRELVAKESGLWQFCIANHLLKKYSDLGDDDEYVIGRWQNGMDGKTTDGEYIDENYDSDIYHQDESYQYRIIESALKDESELEDFLLSNIKVDE